MLCFVPLLRGCVCCYVRKKALLQCLQLLRGGIWACMPLSMSLLGFGMRNMLSNVHMCGIILVLRAVLNMLVRNGSPRGPVCFRFLMFSLSGPCGLLFLLCFIALLDLSCG